MDSMDPMDDDFEIEVTDLNTGAPVPHPLASSVPGEPDSPADDDDDDTDDGDWTPPRPSSPLHRRRARAAIVTGVLALAVVLVILINPTAKSSLYTVFRFPTPVPSPTPLPGANQIFLARGAPWGSASLDGKRVIGANLGMLSAWVTLPRGRHTLVVTQAPFPEVRCTISYPASQRDTCPLISSRDDAYWQFDQSAIPASVRFVDLGARFSRLPQDAQDALLAAATADLQPPSTPLTIHPGDHYVRDDGVVAVARTNLVATFIPTILPPAASVASDSQSCVSFCDISGLTVGGNATWNLRVSLLEAGKLPPSPGRSSSSMRRCIPVILSTRACRPR